MLPTSERSQSVAHAEWGIRPGLTFAFQIDDSDLYDIGMRNAIRLTMRLLREATGDAILLIADELIALRRTAGVLVLDLSWDFWRKELLSEVNMSYTTSDISIK